MNFEQAMEVANTAVFAHIARPLSQVETAILTGAWQSQTYEQIAKVAGYSVSYLTRDVGPKLWKLLSKALGESVSKTNFRAALERQWRSSVNEDQGEKESKGEGEQGRGGEFLLFNPEQRTNFHPCPPAPSHSLTPGLRPAPLTSPHPRCDWGEAVDVSLFCGRTSELATFEQWIQVDRCRLVALLGMVGVGKTSLAVKLAQQIQGEFDFVIWRSLLHAPPLETLLGDLVSFLSDQSEKRADIGQLIQCLRNSRCLVILDNVETILQAGSRAGQYRLGYEGYGKLFREIGESVHQSCLILTSREKPAEVAALEGFELSVRSCQLGGSLEAAYALIQAKGLVGSAQQKQQLCDRYGCNPLALKIVATSIQDLFDGEIGEFLEQNTTVFNSLRRLLNRQFERLSPLEKTVMYHLAVKREWTTISELAAAFVPSVSRARLLEALESLSWRSLIKKRSGSYTQQAVVMEYVTDQLTEGMAA
jgi:hypothetical protein